MPTFAQQRGALQAAFNTAWAGETEIEWENTAFSPPDGAAAEYIRFEMIPDDRQQVTINDAGVFREIGVVRVTIFVREGTGTARAEALAEIVKDSLQRTVLTQGVELYATTRLRGFPTGDGWFGMQTETAYRADADE